MSNYTVQEIIEGKHICPCVVCTASRALSAVLAMPWPEDEWDKLAELEHFFNDFIEHAANREMDHVWEMERFAKALGVEPIYDLMFRRINELTAPRAADSGKE